MAINGAGFFVVEKAGKFRRQPARPSAASISTPAAAISRLDQNGYLVNGAGYYLMGIPIDSTTGNLAGSVPQILQFQNGFLPAQATTEIDYRANLPSYPQTTDATPTVVRLGIAQSVQFHRQPGEWRARPRDSSSAAARRFCRMRSAVLTGSRTCRACSAVAGTLEINGTSIAIGAGDNAASRCRH